MIASFLYPGLLNTGPVNGRLLVVRDGPVNFYIIKGRTGLLCVDTGWRPAQVLRGFAALGLNIRDVRMVLVTHLHWDHARCLPLFPDAEKLAGQGETPSFIIKSRVSRMSLQRVRDGQVIDADGLAVSVIGTPGHTSGSVSYLVDGCLLFTGDTLLLKDGRALPYPAWLNRDNQALEQSMNKLAGIQQAESLLTAHSGMSRNCENAFSKWRTSAGNSPRGGLK